MGVSSAWILSWLSQRRPTVRGRAYLDELERIWGKPWGAQGIGRLREVAMVRPTETEVMKLYEQDSSFFVFDGNMGHVPQDNTLRVDQAFATWSGVGGAPVSCGS